MLPYVYEGSPNPRKWRTIYRDRVPHPAAVQLFSEGRMVWWAEGTVEVVMADLPITVRMRWHWVSGGGRYSLSADAREELVMALRKIQGEAAGAAVGGVGNITDATDWPLILEHLTTSHYPDGSKRETSSMVVLCGASGWQVCLSDRDNGRVMWKTCQSLLDAFQAIEAALGEDNPRDWRQAAAKKGGRK